MTADMTNVPVQIPVYLDNHATTRLDPRVLEAMMPYLTTEYGNASSTTHLYGMRAKEAVERARSQVAALIGASPKEIIFTSGATESINAALKGALACSSRKRVVTTAIEHKAVLDCCHFLQSRGIEVEVVPVTSEGFVDLAALQTALQEETALVSIIHANNEIGTIQPLEEIARLAKPHGALLHVDAAQSLGKIPIQVRSLGIDLMSMSAHKLYGPKGVGALYVRGGLPGVKLEPLLHGGGQERGLRAGTLNVAGIVGLGAACEIARAEMTTEAERLRQLRDLLLARLREGIEGLVVNGSLTSRLPNNLNVSIPGVEGEALLMSLRNEVAVSSGSACASHTREASHVLKAIGRSPALAHSSLRFGLGRFTTREEVEFAATSVIEKVKKLRSLSPRSSFHSEDT
ncbi:MAG: cysteine desulfurase [Candidatus Hydrogenedentota bacterium]|jgi:cysteine desulfurase|nr:MAG: cysteine desulfurase [Candidatus Hydrogenedentota bacterium]